MTAQPGLCRTCRKTLKTGFLTMRLISGHLILSETPKNTFSHDEADLKMYCKLFVDKVEGYHQRQPGSSVCSVRLMCIKDSPV